MLIGKIAGAHGIKGNIKLISFAESLEIFEKDSSVVLIGPDGNRKEAAINWIRAHGRGTLLSLKGVTSRNRVEELIGWELYIEKARLPELEPGVYYWSDLIGLDVITGDGSYLGRIETIIQTGSNDVYVVKDQENEILIPALDNVVIDIDLKKKEMQVDLPEGL